MHISGIHHVAIITADYARSRAFYHDTLGLPIVSESWREDRQSWKLNLALPDGCELEVFSFPSPPLRPSYPEACGLRHLALASTALEQDHLALIASGITVEEIRVDNLTGRRFFFCADPDNLPIEFYQAG